MTISIKHCYTNAVLYEKHISSGMRDALEAAVAVGADLRGAYLRGTSLDGANLRGTSLDGAILRDADLRGADLRGTSLDGANLTGADLRGADLRGADLRGTSLDGASLRDADLRGADLCDADLGGADLRGAAMGGANLRGAKWESGITINRAPLQVNGLRWAVTILDDHMQIGCQLHTLAEWEAFDDAAIIAMDGRDALRFWRENKTALFALARADGRGVEAIETSTSEVAP